jgi:type I pantothenate kinase
VTSARGGGPPSLKEVGGLIAERRRPSGVTIVGVTGSVAAGKTTFAQALAASLRQLADRPGVEIVGTDGFLFPNSLLEQRGLIGRKGFPETYDVAALRVALAAVRAGPADFPGYSHVLYDIDPALVRRLDPPGILIVEGLGLDLDRNGDLGVQRLLDVLIYLDAREADIEAWFTDRFLGLCEAAAIDPKSFYARFDALSPQQRRSVAAEVWRAINLPNLRDHIAPAMAGADIIITKGPGHEIVAIRNN